MKTIKYIYITLLFVLLVVNTVVLSHDNKLTDSSRENVAYALTFGWVFLFIIIALIIVAPKPSHS